MEDWVIQVVGGGITLIVGYAVLRKTVSSHDEQIKEIKKDHSYNLDLIDKRINAGFKRLDEVATRITVLEQSTKEHLGLREAEERFVSHKELQLHIANIESTLKHMEKESVAQSKKLDYLTELISTNIVKSITPHGAVFGGNHG